MACCRCRASDASIPARRPPRSRSAPCCRCCRASCSGRTRQPSSHAGVPNPSCRRRTRRGSSCPDTAAAHSSCVRPRPSKTVATRRWPGASPRFSTFEAGTASSTRCGGRRLGPCVARRTRDQRSHGCSGAAVRRARGRRRDVRRRPRDGSSRPLRRRSRPGRARPTRRRRSRRRHDHVDGARQGRGVDRDAAAR